MVTLKVQGAIKINNVKGVSSPLRPQGRHHLAKRPLAMRAQGHPNPLVPVVGTRGRAGRRKEMIGSPKVHRRMSLVWVC